MGERIMYCRVSTKDQDIASQRHALGGPFDKEFLDEGVSGVTQAADRPGFKDLLAYARSGDTIYVTTAVLRRPAATLRLCRPTPAAYAGC